METPRRKYNWSKLAIFFIVIAELSSIFSQPRWHYDNVIVWDMEQYYMYLPATFIYKDLSFSFVKDLEDKKIVHKFWFVPTNNSSSGTLQAKKPILENHPTQNKGPGGPDIKTGKMSLGMSFLYLPFFLIAHTVVQVSPFPANGYSTPYQLCIFFSGFFYTLLGFIYLRKLLKMYFSEVVTAITILCTALGTNLYYYVVTEGAMTHAAIFGLSCVYFYQVLQWHKTHSWKNIVPMAICAGFVILVRPIALPILLFFFLYGISGFPSFKKQLLAFKNHFGQLILLLGILFLIALPQLIYWKYASGHFIFYSYSKEGFFFNHPVIWRGLFSYRKGWLLYTPMMGFALLGFLWLWQYEKKLFLPIVLYLCIFIYVVFSWWCWWYGGSFGMRAMIDAYPFLAFPMAVFWSEIAKRKNLFKLSLAIAFLFVFLNQFQTIQYQRGILHWDGMNEKAYWGIFLKMEHLPDEDKVMDKPDYDGAMKDKDR